MTTRLERACAAWRRAPKEERLAVWLGIEGDELPVSDAAMAALEMLVAANVAPRKPKPAADPLERADLRVEYYAAPGQGVNEGPRGVTITHVPTGLRTSCYEDAPVHANKATALAALRELVARRPTTKPGRPTARALVAPRKAKARASAEAAR